VTQAQIGYLRLCFLLETDREVEAQAEREDFSRRNGYYFPKFQALERRMTSEHLREVEEIARQVFEGR
jgi:hypothetical protein